MARAESEDAALLLERLLTDGALRERFRRDPAGVSREAGLERVAAELRVRDRKVLHTLDGRESRSSLAGVLMAAALEGADVFDFSRHVAAHVEGGVPEPVEHVLARHGGHAAGSAGLAEAHAAVLPEPLHAPDATAPSPPSAAGEFRAITPREAAAAAVDRSAPELPGHDADTPDSGSDDHGHDSQPDDSGGDDADDEGEDEEEDEDEDERRKTR